MGTEALWVPLVLSAAGAGLSEYNQRKTAKKQDADIAAGIRKNAETQQKANAKVNENLNFIEESKAKPFKDTLQGQFLQRINQEKRAGLAGFDQVGNVSDAYKSGVSSAKTGAIDYGRLVSDLLSGVDAAGNQRQAEVARSGDLSMDLSKFGRDISQDEYLARLRAARHRDNPWLSIASSALKGAGSSYGGEGGWGGAT